MAGPPTPAFSQLTCRYTGIALPHGAATTHGFTTPAGPLADVLDAIEQFGVDLAVALTAEVTLLNITWKVGPEATGPSQLVDVGVAGSQTGSTAPPQVANLVHLRPAGVSGRFAGRFYLPGVNELSVAQDGQLTVPYAGAVLAAVEQAYSAMDAVGATPVIFPADASDPRPVEAINVSTRCATQRRRLRR